MNKKLYLLIGLPCVGKSTWVKSFLSNSNDQHYSIMSTDQYLEGWALNEGISYHESFDKYYKHAERAMRANLFRSVKQGFNIIWDQTNLTKASRKWKLSITPQDYEKIGIYFPTPNGHAQLIAE